MYFKLDHCNCETDWAVCWLLECESTRIAATLFLCNFKAPTNNSIGFNSFSTPLLGMPQKLKCFTTLLLISNHFTNSTPHNAFFHWPIYTSHLNTSTKPSLHFRSPIYNTGPRVHGSTGHFSWTRPLDNSDIRLTRSENYWRVILLTYLLLVLQCLSLSNAFLIRPNSIQFETLFNVCQ